MDVLEYISSSISTLNDKFIKHVEQNKDRFLELENEIKALSTEGVAMSDGMMSDPVALMALSQKNQGTDGLFGGGGGIIGGLLLGSLLRNGGGVFGSTGDGGSAVNQLTLGQIQQTLGDIKASVPLAESQVQLALAGAQADINGNINTGNMVLNKAVSDAIAASLASQSAIKETILASSQAGITATMAAKFELANLIRDDGDKTRALLITQNEATLQRQLAVAEAALAEQRAVSRSRDVEVNVTQMVNQQQSQAQQQQNVLNLHAAVSALAAQVNRGQQDIINLGTMVGNTQSSAQTNVR